MRPGMQGLLTSRPLDDDVDASDQDGYTDDHCEDPAPLKIINPIRETGYPLDPELEDEPQADENDDSSPEHDPDLAAARTLLLATVVTFLVDPMSRCQAGTAFIAEDGTLRVLVSAPGTVNHCLFTFYLDIYNGYRDAPSNER